MIDWSAILEGNHKKELTQLYADHRSIEDLADALGVSKNALRTKLLLEEIQLRPKGGVQPGSHRGRSKLDAVSAETFQHLTVEEIATVFDMDVSAVYKYAHKRGIPVGRKANETRTGDSDQVHEDGMSSKDSLVLGAVEPDQGQEGDSSET